MKRTKFEKRKPPDEIDYRGKCIAEIKQRDKSDKTSFTFDIGVAKMYGNDFAIYLANLIKKQRYFQWYFPQYRGDFFLTEKDQIEQTNLKHHSIQTCKKLALDMGVFTAQLQSRTVKGVKSTKEWYTFNWRVLYDLYQNSAYPKTDRQSKKSNKLTTHSVSTDMNPSNNNSAYPKTEGYIRTRIKGTYGGDTDVPLHTTDAKKYRKKASTKDTSPKWRKYKVHEPKYKFVIQDGIKFELCSDLYYRDFYDNIYIE